MCPRHLHDLPARLRGRKTKDPHHLARVAALGCIICRGPAECHHVRAGVGMGRKATDYETIPLCAAHHRTGGYSVVLHAGRKAFETRYGTEREFLQKTLAMLEAA